MNQLVSYHHHFCMFRHLWGCNSVRKNEGKLLVVFLFVFFCKNGWLARWHHCESLHNSIARKGFELNISTALLLSSSVVRSAVWVRRFIRMLWQQHSFWVFSSNFFLSKEFNFNDTSCIVSNYKIHSTETAAVESFCVQHVGGLSCQFVPLTDRHLELTNVRMNFVCSGGMCWDVHYQTTDQIAGYLLISGLSPVCICMRSFITFHYRSHCMSSAISTILWLDYQLCPYFECAVTEYILLLSNFLFLELPETSV